MLWGSETDSEDGIYKRSMATSNNINCRREKGLSLCISFTPAIMLQRTSHSRRVLLFFISRSDFHFPFCPPSPLRLLSCCCHPSVAPVSRLFIFSSHSHHDDGARPAKLTAKYPRKTIYFLFFKCQPICLFLNHGRPRPSRTAHTCTSTSFSARLGGMVPAAFRSLKGQQLFWKRRETECE